MNGKTRQAAVDDRLVGDWRRPLVCGDNGGCFEFAPSTIGVAVRDSKLGDASPILHFTAAEMQAMLAAAQAGEFDDLAAG